MKKTLPLALLLLAVSLFTGCTNQPVLVDKSSLGHAVSPSETLSKNKVKVLTLETQLTFGGTHITAESGSHITITPNSIKGN